MFLTERQILLAAVQALRGTPVVPTAAVPAYEISIPKGLSEAMERGSSKATLGHNSKVIITKGQNIEFKSELKGSGTKGVVPEIGVLFRMCRMAEIITADTDVQYLPTSDKDHEVGTLYFYNDGRLYQLADACGTYQIDLTAGKFGVVTFQLTGSYIKPVDAVDPVVADSDIVPPRFAEADFQFDSTNLIIDTLNITMGNEVVERKDANSVNGIKGYMITDKKATCSFDPEAVAEAELDIHGIWASSVAKSLSTTLGSTDGNKVTITAPKVQLITIDPGSRDKIVTHQNVCDLIPDAGDDEFSLVFA